MFELIQPHAPHHLKPRSHGSKVGVMVRQFVRFCHFYGEYQSLPPCDRRQFVIHYPVRS